MAAISGAGERGTLMGQGRRGHLQGYNVESSNGEASCRGLDLPAPLPAPRTQRGSALHRLGTSSCCLCLCPEQGARWMQQTRLGAKRVLARTRGHSSPPLHPKTTERRPGSWRLVQWALPTPGQCPRSTAHASRSWEQEDAGLSPWEDGSPPRHQPGARSRGERGALTQCRRKEGGEEAEPGSAAQLCVAMATPAVRVRGLQRSGVMHAGGTRRAQAAGMSRSPHKGHC